MNDDMFKKAFDAIDDEFLADAKNPTIRIAARRKKIIVSSIAACVAAVLVAIPSIKVLSDIDDNKITTKPEIEYEYEYEEQIVHRPSTSSKTSKPQNSQVESKPQTSEIESAPQNSQISSNPQTQSVSSNKETLTSSQEETSSKNVSSKKPTIIKGPTSSKKQTSTKGPGNTSSKKQTSSKGPSYTSSNKQAGHTSATSSTTSKPSGIDLDDDIKINIRDIIALFSVNSEITTYEKIYAPIEKYLYINPIPTDKYVTIYQEYYEKELDKNEALTLANKLFPKLATAFNATLSPYKVENPYSDSIRIDPSGPIYLSQCNNRNTIAYDPRGNATLFGKPITVNQTQSDEEIINSISDIKPILFDTFDVSFDSVKIRREYDNDNNHGVWRLIIDFYNSSDHPLNDLPGVSPFSDYISIDFHNYNDTASSTDLYFVYGIWYWSYRTNNHSDLKPIAQKELLPLKKAEEYLSKGYVLAEGCSLCQSEQTPVDFTYYDHVSFEYKRGYEIGDLTLPYYAFYKSIGTAENGNLAFAKTYVPAVEFEGYEEYFENKHNNHNSNNNNSSSNNNYALEDNGE